MTRSKGDRPGDSNEALWCAEARRISRRVNVAAWLDAWLPWQAGLTTAVALGLLVVRRQSGPTLGVAVVWLAALTGSAALAAWRSRSRFESTSDGLVRLETGLRLHNRLSAAAAGVGDWPVPVGPEQARPCWRASRIGAPLVLPVLLLAVAALIPITVSGGDGPPPPSAPLAWQRVEDWLGELERERLVSEESLELWRQRLDELRTAPSEHWYDHGSLEAGDTLQAQLEATMAEFGEGLEAAADDVGALGAEGPRDAVRDRLREALSQLESGALALSPELAEALRRSADAASPAELTTLDMDELERRLREGAAACRGRPRVCPPDDPFCGLGAAPARGPGTVPLAGTATAPEELDTRLEALEGSSDLDRAALGELLSTSRAAHRIEHGDFAGTLPSGDASTGQGGEAVWRDALTPREREILRRYFQ